MSAPTAGAAAQRPHSGKTITVKVSSVERQFCATRSVTGRGVSRVTVKAPVNGTIAARTSGPRSADWDLAILDKKRDMVLTGSSQRAAREHATTFVRKGQKVVLQTCRRDGSSRLRIHYVFWKLPKAQKSSYTKKLVRVSIATTAAGRKLERLGLDKTDHPGEFHWDVLLHSAADEAKLKRSGLEYSVRIADVVRKDRRNRLSEQRAGRASASRARARASIVSGRTTYRTLPEIEEELRRLAEQNPGLVRLFALPRRSWEGREILGVEIAENVNATDDGRPAYIQVGTHHAREWPANEATLEWGLDLVNGYKTGNARLTGIVKGARTFVIPVLNVDGFNVTIQSEGLSPGGNYTDPLNSTYPGPPGHQSLGTGAYKRKNCRPLNEPATPEPPGSCLARSFPPTPLPPPEFDAMLDRGVDPNRNYGVEWGGPGTDTTRESLVWHGGIIDAAGNPQPRPFSEPETDGFRRFVRDLQPAVLITNHTFTGLILRPPGTSTFGPVPDEERLRALGDAMADQVQYKSQYSYQLYDTTGTTDDYIYDGLGAFSYTPEIGKVEFHPAFSSFVEEYDGAPEVDRYGDPTGRRLGGLREAYTLAGEAALDRGTHSVLQGTAPAGRTLRISKTITYKTSERPDDEGVQYPVQTITEPRVSTMTVPGNGQFSWHVNPSRQPRDFGQEPGFWRLTCEDGAGNVLEERSVYVERAQTLNLALSCGENTTPTEPAVLGNCPLPNGFRSVDARRRGSGLRISFQRAAGVTKKVNIVVVQTSKNRKVFRRVQRKIGFRNRTRSFTWNGRGLDGKRLTDGVYYVRFRVQDAANRIDTRRVVVERRNGRFGKKPTFYLADRCG